MNFKARNLKFYQMTKTALIYFSLLFFVPCVFSQHIVSGLVTDLNQEPLPGVSVAVENMPLGTVTDSTGAFALDVPPEGTALVFSCVGFEKTKAGIVRGKILRVQMKPSGLNLPQVVVTALNIERKSREIGHSTQRLEGRDLAEVQETNLTNSLAGKVAGLQVLTSSGNLGGSTRLVLRGVRSLFGENQPLFVIDGVPLDNSNFNEALKGGYEGNGIFNSTIDFGNTIQDINPQDIATLDVLKGPAAAALYGSRGGNGAIVLTTRRGRLNTPLTVTLNSQTLIEQVATLPDFQDVYGGGNGDFRVINGELVQHFNPDYSWGPRIDPEKLVRQWYSYFPEIPEYYGKATPWTAHPDNVRDFFQTGVALRNYLAISGGTEKVTYRFGYANLRQTSIYPNSLLQRHQFSTNLGFQIRRWLHFSVNGNYTTHQAEGRASSGEYPSVTQSLTTWFQRQLDMNLLRKYYVTPTGRQGSWNLASLDDPRPIYWNNPYWEQYKNAPKDGRDRFFGNLAGTVNLLPGLRLIGRVGLDNYTDLREQKRAFGSAALTGLYNIQPFYSVSTYQVWEFNAEGLLEYAKILTDAFSLRAMAGANQRVNHAFSQRLSTTNGLKQPDVYAISNSVGVPNATVGRSDSEVNSWFSNATLGFRNTVFLDLAARSDALSTLPSGANRLFYPSASIGFVFSELPALKNQPVISFGKIRANWAQAGSGAPAASLVKTYAGYFLEDGTPLAFINDPGNSGLRPQKTISLETGLELRLLGERIGLDLSLYRTTTYDQILSLPISPTTGFAHRTVNAGAIRNQGIELTLQVATLRRKHFSWQTTLNWAANDNRIVELYHDENGNDITSLQLASYYGLFINAQEGQPYGTLHASDVHRDPQGRPIINPNTGEYISKSIAQNFGSVQPDWFGGVQNTFSYKGFHLGFLVDFSKGGTFLSSTVLWGRRNGLFEETAMNGNREAGAALPGVLQATDGDGNLLFNPDGSPAPSDKTNDIVLPAKDYWQNFSNFSTAIFDATYVKLREASLAWDVPGTWLQRIGFSKCTAALIGRNLWLIYRDLPHLDPNQVASSGNVQGIEAGMTPPARIFGLSLDFKF